MAYLRWTFDDGVTTAIMPVNPASQSSPFAERSITGKRTTEGALVLTEGERQVATMSFSGITIHKAHYDMLHAWAYGQYSQKIITITDHYGREITGAMQSFSPSSPQRAKPGSGLAWYHTYDATFVVTSVGPATRGDNWEPI